MRPSHLDDSGAPRMVDVGAKTVSARRAVARASVSMRPDVLEQLVAAGGPKGDALVTARLAGINAAKQTSALIPLCHPIALDVVHVELSPDVATGSVTVRSEVRATARTGVEMEALTAVSVAALTLYDMAKAFQRDIRIVEVVLVEKEGGRSGAWRAGEPVSLPPVAPADHEAVVVTCSTRSAAGDRPDASGPALVAALASAGWDVDPDPRLVSDDVEAIAGLLASLADAGHRLIITTGGTGLTPTDVTPAATQRVIDRLVPGMAEEMRAAGLRTTPTASLSRGVVGTRGGALIVNLPGSQRGAIESIDALLPVLRHAVEQLTGSDH